DGVAIAKRQAEQIAAEVASQGGPADLADKKVTALVAYMQRLGTDLFTTVEEETSATGDSP
ncbi:MAG: hypothetical protein AAGJ97_12075, partial [Planctomycetota bacterium]